MNDVNRETYDVCLSFADEQRVYVEKVAQLLVQRGVSTFYDRAEEANLWGKNLYEELTSIYRDRARYCVLFASREYVNKMWTSHEYRAAQARAIRDSHEYVLPVRFDDSEVPGLTETIVFVDARRRTEEQLVELIVEKLRRDTAAAQNLSGQQLLARAYSMGLADIENRADPAHASPPANFLVQARQEIIITGVTAKYTFTRLASEIHGALSRGIRVRAMLLDPESPDLSWMQNQESVRLSDEIRYVTRIIRDQFSHLRGFEARALNYAPPFTALSLDQFTLSGPSSAKIRVQPSVRFASQHSGIVLRFDARDDGGRQTNAPLPIEYFAGDLERQWGSGSTITSQVG